VGALSVEIQAAGVADYAAPKTWGMMPSKDRNPTKRCGEDPMYDDDDDGDGKMVMRILGVQYY